MNAFALHDVSDQAAVRRWGASAFAIVAAHAALIAIGDELVHAAAGARRLPACDHGRHGAGFVRAAADADGPRAGTGDAAGRRLAAGAGGCGSRAGADRADAAAGEAGSRRAAGAEGGADAGEARARQGRAREKADAGEAESRSPGRQEADRGAACAAHDGARRRAERQAPAASAASAGASAAALASYRQLVRAHLLRFKQYPPAAKAAGQQGIARVSFTLSRSGQVLSQPASAARRAIRRWMPRRLAMVRRAQPFPAFPSGYEAGARCRFTRRRWRSVLAVERIAYSFTAPVSDET